ncbi:hypothetical protein ACX9NE_01275 [Mycobacterium sp. ML4]
MSPMIAEPLLSVSRPAMRYTHVAASVAIAKDDRATTGTCIGAARDYGVPQNRGFLM